MNNTTTRPQPTTNAPDRALRIGFFTDTYAPQVNGIAISLQLLARELRAAGHQVTVFAPRFPGYHDPESEVYRLPAVRYMQMPPVYLAVPGTPRATLALRRCQFDIVHAHSPLSLGLLAYLTAQAKGAPLIYTYHTSITDYTHHLKMVGRTRPVRRAAGWFSTASTNLGDQIIAPSAKFKRLLESQNVRRPIHTIPNGIDLRNFDQPKNPGAYRRRLGLAEDAPLLVYVGRVDPEKRIDFLIAAFGRLAARRTDAHLVIAGDGSARRALEAQAAASGYGGRIHFLGMVNRADLPDLLHDADLFLSASTSETQCLAMVEAIAAGLPVVAVRDDAFEGILADGVNGRAVPREAEALSAAADNLLAAPTIRQAFGRNSVELSRKFSIEAQVESLTGLYREAIAVTISDAHQRTAA